MKKVLSLLLVLTLCLGLLAGCQNDPVETTGSTAPSTQPTTKPTEPEIQVITIAQALELCGEEGNITEERYYIRGTIETITNAQYGAMVIKDETGSIAVYGTYSEDGSIGYADMENKPYKGDVVLLHCILQNYNGTKEIKNARLISFEVGKPDYNESDYREMSIADARESVKGTPVKVTGVVAAITYANGMKPSGLYLVDNTASILIHDADLAQRVQVGNTITILGTKTYWILESEQNNADKFGYRGSCQLEDCKLLSNDEKTDTAFDRSWIQESTVKQLMDTPMGNNVTTQIYKVTALVSVKPGSGFTNYYFYDLDGKTGSYTYTQCNGSDFEWLSAFDGKICTVYLSIINAKSTDSACIYRFFPIAVEDEGFSFDLADTAEHVVKYYGLGQFDTNYTGDPMIQLQTTVSSDLLGFKNAKLSYASSDPSVVKFQEIDNRLYFRCLQPGKATITITGSYEGKEYSQTLEITVGAAEMYDSLTIGEALKAENGSTVIVTGIVGPSVVNKSGFYLIDETGLVAILMDAEDLATLKPGQEITITGTFFRFGEDDSKQKRQTRIEATEILANAYGNHTYDTSLFITDKTLADFAALDESQDHTTTVYILKATVNLEETNFYTRLDLVDGDAKVALYSASANQYAFLKAFAGQEVTIELAACDWNDKGIKGCVLAVYTADGEKIINELNFQ